MFLQHRPQLVQSLLTSFVQYLQILFVLPLKAIFFLVIFDCFKNDVQASHFS